MLHLRVACAVFGVLAFVACALAGTTPSGTQFTYQGLLKSGGNAVNENIDIRARLFDAVSGPDQVGGQIEVLDVDCVEGVFSVELDFGSEFGSQARWLEIDVKLSTQPPTSYVTLTPRQRINNSPLALFSLSTGQVPDTSLLGTYSSAMNFSNAGNTFAGSFSGSGAALTGLSASNISTGTLSSGRLSGTYSNALVLDNASNVFSGLFQGTLIGSGSGISNLNASNISSGTLSTSRLPSTVALLAGAQTFTGAKTFTESVNIALSGVSNNVPLHVSWAVNNLFNDPLAVLKSLESDKDAKIRFENSAGGWYALGMESNGGFALSYDDNSTVETDYLRVTSSGKFGIALPPSTPPGLRLDIVGPNVTAQSSGNSGGTGLGNGIVRIRPTGDVAALDIGAHSSHAWLQARHTDDYSVDLNLVLNPNGGSVGIGTNAPVQALDVIGPGGPAASSGNGHNGMIRVRPDNSSLVLDVGGTGGSAHGWLQARDADNYALNYNLILNPNGGNVGIGTAAPNVSLEVAGLGRFTGTGGFSIGSDAGQKRISSTGAGNQIFAFLDSSDSYTGARLKQVSIGGSFGDTNAPTDGLLVQGSVGIGRTPTTNKLEVEGSASKTSAGSWLANSDARIKMHVHDLDDALDVISKIRPVGFRYTEEYRKVHPTLEDVEYYNVIAQEFAEVFPDSVKDSGEKTSRGENILQVDTYPMLIHAVAAIQQLRAEKDAEITALQKENDELRARMERMEAMMEQLTAK